MAPSDAEPWPLSLIEYKQLHLRLESSLSLSLLPFVAFSS